MAFFTERSSIVHIVLQLRIFITVFDVVRRRGSHRQTILVEPSVSLALLA